MTVEASFTDGLRHRTGCDVMDCRGFVVLSSLLLSKLPKYSRSIGAIGRTPPPEAASQPRSFNAIDTRRILPPDAV